jgi:YD repeat-containing protein
MVKTIVVLAAGVALAPVVAWAANEVYTYDNAGRLITVDHGDGRTTTYSLDPAGNRTALQTSMQTAPPDTVAAPSSSTTGSYSISWTASASPGVTTYKLWEATNAAFTGETLVCQTWRWG